MRTLFRRALWFTGSAVAMLALEAVSRRKGRRGNAARALLERVRPRPIPDDTIEARVRRKLARTASNPDAITISIEHGCVDLRGPVPTRERAHIVRAISAVRGVDSVVDLMTEPQVEPSLSASPSALRPVLQSAF
jgi:hypothetical protein